MTDYRRHWLAGGTLFFTMALADRLSSLLVNHIEDLKKSIRHVKNEGWGRSVNLARYGGLARSAEPCARLSAA